MVPPVTELLKIFSSDAYTNFENETIKRHVTEKIHVFTKAAVAYDSFPKDQDQDLMKAILSAITSEKLPILEKCRLFILLTYRMQEGYLKMANDVE